MGRAHPPKTVKLIVGMLSSSEELFVRACRRLAQHWGELEAQGVTFPFDQSDYYEPEMGPGLLRRFVGFRRLISPRRLAGCKTLSNRLETEFAVNGKRLINLDPGYLNDYQLVLASTKSFAHRIYLEKGIYAELTLLYRRGEWQDLPWTYPDYRLPQSKEFFLAMRRRYRRQQRPGAEKSSLIPLPAVRETI